jgi:hypothetical protein
MPSTFSLPTVAKLGKKLDANEGEARLISLGVAGLSRQEAV